MNRLIGNPWEVTAFTCLSHLETLLVRCPECRSITCPKCRTTCFGCNERLPHFFESQAVSV